MMGNPFIVSIVRRITGDRSLDARAFRVLVGELLRLPWIEGIVAGGSAPSRGWRRSGSGTLVSVIVAGGPDGEKAAEVERVVSRVNRRFGSRLRALLVAAGDGTPEPRAPGGKPGDD